MCSIFTYFEVQRKSSFQILHLFQELSVIVAFVEVNAPNKCFITFFSGIGLFSVCSGRVYVLLLWPTRRRVYIRCLHHVTLVGSCNRSTFNVQCSTCSMLTSIDRKVLCFLSPCCGIPNGQFSTSGTHHTPSMLFVDVKQQWFHLPRHLSSQPRQYGSSWTF